jgi:hypothetical protein
MLTLKTSVAAAILLSTAAASAGAGYLVTKATMQANVALRCPNVPAASTSGSAQPQPFPPLGNVPSTSGGKQW